MHFKKSPAGRIIPHGGPRVEDHCYKIRWWDAELCTVTWRLREEWGKRGKDSNVTGKCHASFILALEKEPFGRDWLTPGTGFDDLVKRKSSAPVGNLTLFSRSSKPCCDHFNDIRFTVQVSNAGPEILWLSSFLSAPTREKRSMIAPVFFLTSSHICS